MTSTVALTQKENRIGLGARKATEMTKKEEFIKACLRAHDRERGESDLGYWENRVKEHRIYLTDAVRQMQVALNNQKSPNFESEFESLFKTHLVEDVDINGDILSIHTGLIICTNPVDGLQYELGKFEIQISISGGYLSIFNKTRRVDAWFKKMHAPHVNADGHPCLGNIEGSFWEMVGKLNFSVAAQLIIGFLQTVNTENDDWGKTVVNWPLYHGNGPTRKDKANEARRRRRAKAG